MKRPELADAVDPDDLTGNDDDQVAKPDQPNDKREIDAMIAAVRAQLDEATFQVAWAEGHELLLEQAVVEALDE